MIEINTESEKPIYLQLIYQIKRLILNNQLKEGDTLPSVRSLGSDLGINLHTVNKVYKLLEEEGIVTQFKKRFVVNSWEEFVIQEDEKLQIKELLREIVIDTTLYNLSLNDLIDEVTIELNEEDGGR